MNQWSFRFGVLLSALVLLWGIVIWFNQAHARYWLRHDGTQGVATITAEGFKHTVHYAYSVSGTRYTGHSQRDWQDPRHSEVRIGQSTPVRFSKSHPWVSSLPAPQHTLDSFPWVLGALALESLLLYLMVAPWGRSRTDSPPRDLPAESL